MIGTAVDFSKSVITIAVGCGFLHGEAPASTTCLVNGERFRDPFPEAKVAVVKRLVR